MHPVSASKPADRLVAIFAAVVGFFFVAWAVFLTFADFAHAFTRNRSDAIGSALLMVGWVTLPYIVLAWCALRISTDWFSRTLLVSAVCGCAVLGISEFADGNSALVVVPLFQLVCTAFVLVLVRGYESGPEGRWGK